MTWGAAVRQGCKELLFGAPAPLAAANFRRLGLLSLALALLLWSAPAGRLSWEEGRAWDRVRSAQDRLAALRASMGIASPKEEDPYGTGLIGREWSSLTTTLGSLPAKRTSTDPVWAVLFLRWFDELGLRAGDRVLFLSSASFPGLLLSGLVAAEERGLETLLLASLGASTWGANVPEFPLPVILSELRRSGHVAAKAHFYTLGGDDERGLGLPGEGIALLRAAAEAEDVPLCLPEDIEAVIEAKMNVLRAFQPRLVVQIGGSRANLGEETAVFDLPPGLLRPSRVTREGDGVIVRALTEGFPVLHLLNLKELARREGIPFDGVPRRKGPGRWLVLRAAGAVILFLLFLVRYRRWEVRP